MACLQGMLGNSQPNVPRVGVSESALSFLHLSAQFHGMLLVASLGGPGGVVPTVLHSS